VAGAADRLPAARTAHIDITGNHLSLIEISFRDSRASQFRASSPTELVDDHGGCVKGQKDLIVTLVIVPVVVTTTVVLPVAISFAKIPVSIPVPMMVVLNYPSGSLPVALKESISVVLWWYPTSALVWWSGPVTLMPLVMSSLGIPIAHYPNELRPGCRLNIDDPGRGRGTN